MAPPWSLRLSHRVLRVRGSHDTSRRT